jgi:hypothetical protein
MATYQATPKGLIRGAVIQIEELLAHGTLNKQQKHQMAEEAQCMLHILGEEAEAREPEPEETIGGLLESIKTILDVADLEQRQLNAIEIPIVTEHAQGLLSFYRGV